MCMEIGESRRKTIGFSGACTTFTTFHQLQRTAAHHPGT